eukprot:jgi/Ulvmu1/11881/UM081_0039.1
MLDNCVVVFVLGGPGSGKGTHCQRIKESLGWVHLSTGDLFRAEVERGTEQGVLLRDIMAEGGMVPVEITIGLLQAEMEASSIKRFLIDGFPRAMEQAEAFEQHICRARTALFFDCPEDSMLQRALLRGRADDNQEAMQKRLDLFRQTSMPIVDWFAAQNRLMRIDNSRPVDEVAGDVFAAFLQLHEELGLPVPGASTASAGAADSGGGDLIALDDGPAAPEAEAQPAAEAADLLGLDDPPAPSGAEAEVAGEGLLRPVVVIGPSGVGKGTLIGRLMEQHRDRFGFTVSHTTRAPREGEEDGVHYHFVTREAMERDIAAGRFLEHAEVHGNLYGTSTAAVHAVAAAGNCAILDIDVQGARQVRAGPHGGHALLLFVAPPSLDELERRLRGRGTETEERVQRRLANAVAEMAASEEPGFVDAVIVNDDLDAAYSRLEAAIAGHAPDLMPGVASQVAAGAPGAVARGNGAGPSTAVNAPMETPGEDAEPDAASRPAAAGPSAGAGPSSAAVTAEGEAGTKEYLRGTVVPAIEAALLAVAAARPDDPLQFVIDHLTKSKL